MWRQDTFVPGLLFMVGVSASDNVQHGLQGIVCAEVTHIAKHPNADRLKVCQLNAGSTSIQVI